MRRVDAPTCQPWRASRAALAGWCALVASLSPLPALAAPSCERSIYLTFDTGHMGVAPLIREVLDRQQVKATFFLANERTQAVGARPAGASLDDHWAPWWKSLAQAGHDFGSHTWDHVVFKGDRPEGFAMVPTAGDRVGQRLMLTPLQYCAQLQRSAARFEAMTGQPMRALFRAPGGKTSGRLLREAERCGWHHVPWTPAGFLGDELPSAAYPNQALLAQSLKRIRTGDILLAHLGIWSRQDAWAPAVLEPLITGLKARGLCFATLRDHPDYRAVGQAPRLRD